MMAGHRDDRGYCAGLQHQGAPGDAHACHVRGQAAGDPVHQRVQCAHCQHQRANQQQEVHPEGEDICGQGEQRCRYLRVLERLHRPVADGGDSGRPQQEGDRYGQCRRPHRLRVSNFWLSTVYTRCHIPG